MPNETTDRYAAENDPLYQAAHAYLTAKNAVLWSDFDISRPDRRRTAALWLTAQLRGVAEHYTAPTPFADYAGPYTAEAGGGGLPPQPTALRRTDGPV